MKIGVLAVQGAFIEHEKMLAQLGVDSFEIRQKSDLNKDYQGLILPGGESTVMEKLVRELDIYDTILDNIKSGMPVFGTCAGLLLLANKIDNNGRKCFSTMDIVAKRNAYGRQLGSFSVNSEFKGIGEIPMRFIRAPYISDVGKDVEVLSVVEDKIVAAKQGNQLVTAFHPEITDCTLVHKFFIDMIK